MTVDQQPVLKITEIDWKNAAIEVDQIRTLHVCRISVNGLDLFGDIDSSPAVDKTAYALRIRLNYSYDSEYWKTLPDGRDKKMGQMRNKLAQYNSKQLKTGDKMEIFGLLNINSKTPLQDLDIGYFKSDVTGDAAICVLLKNNSRLEPQKLGELIAATLGWQIEPLTLEQIASLKELHDR